MNILVTIPPIHCNGDIFCMWLTIGLFTPVLVIATAAIIVLWRQQ